MEDPFAKRLTPYQEAIASCIMQAGGFATWAVIADHLYADGEHSPEYEQATIVVQLSKMRRKLAPGWVLKTHWGRGVELSTTGELYKGVQEKRFGVPLKTTLTHGEEEILDMIANRGRAYKFSTREIVDALGCTNGSVTTIISRIKEKLKDHTIVSLGWGGGWTLTERS